MGIALPVPSFQPLGKRPLVLSTGSLAFLPIAVAVGFTRKRASEPRGRLLIGASALLWLGYGLCFLLMFYTTGAWSFGGRYLMDILPYQLVLVFAAYTYVREIPAAKRLSWALFFPRRS